MEREDPQANEEFIVCDGNHRVVQYLWNGGKGARLHCVLVRGPAEPYYAHPFSTRDWNVTATNVLHYPPDLYGKYTPRRFEPGAPSEDPANPLWYRRYYRDFSSAFIDVGDQGGQRSR